MSTTLPPAGPAAWTTDPYARALSRGRGPLFLRRKDGWLLPLDVERWCAEADAADLSALRRSEGPVIDIGCGPGRLVAALAARGHRALGIDVSEAAIGRTQRIGGPALRRSVFEPLPGEGRWGTALLIDGNIGIGGDPQALLRRVGAVLAPGACSSRRPRPTRWTSRSRYASTTAGGPPVRRTSSGPVPGSPPCSGTPVRRTGSPSISGRRTVKPFLALRRARTVRTTSQSADTANSAAVISSQFPRNLSGDIPLAGS